MTDPPILSKPSEITEEVVAQMALAAGLAIPTARLGAVTARLREMHEMAAGLARLDLDGIEPAASFDPSWAEDPTS
ncbi:MAG: hypothetical protein ACR2OO_12915 [Thermomicrobiales bacterium]